MPVIGQSLDQTAQLRAHFPDFRAMRRGHLFQDTLAPAGLIDAIGLKSHLTSLKGS
jgi:hypothetical protein